MAIEISGTNSRKTQNSGNNTVKSVNNKHSAATMSKTANSTSKNVDKVSLTDTAARLRELERGLANQPVVDVERVQSVQGAIKEGTFEVDPDSVAEKMIEFEGSLDSNSVS